MDVFGKCYEKLEITLKIVQFAKWMKNVFKLVCDRYKIVILPVWFGKIEIKINVPVWKKCPIYCDWIIIKCG